MLAWASVAVAVALWLADGGAAGFSTPAGSFTALGIVAGLAGMDLVLLMLLLAARIPLIDGTVGHDRALEFHRKLGKPSLYLLLAHGILIAIGYGMAEGLDPVSELVALWVLVPDMWLAYRVHRRCSSPSWSPPSWPSDGGSRTSSGTPSTC